eukprot:TRINITY_DN2859_c2_g1_i1.p2 TRINITY_DN2859_c2_g1~~TRINITY_DN2859_c2_g1_i1.p2  ORF type:complete len:358 (-),score=30.75 TRINITY_DN2859_c2_g1_i1:321-1394(-)
MSGLQEVGCEALREGEMHNLLQEIQKTGQCNEQGIIRRHGAVRDLCDRRAQQQRYYPQSQLTVFYKSFHIVCLYQCIMYVRQAWISLKRAPSITVIIKEPSIILQSLKIFKTNTMDQSKMSAMPMKSLEPESDEEEQEIEDTLESLKEHLKECQKLGKYVEAQMAQNRIAELKERMVNNKLTKLKASQEKELHIFEQAHKKELAALENSWRQKLDEHDSRARVEEDNLLEKHEKELTQARREAETKIPEKVHPSQEYVALKKMEEALAKQGKQCFINKRHSFEEAHKIKMEATLKEQQEQAQWDEEREAKIQCRLQVIVARQTNELEVMRATHAKARTAIEKSMAEDIEQQQQTYNR